jgi:hypothetical protein
MLSLGSGKVDVNSKEYEGETLLLLAAEYGNEAVIKALHI